MDAEIREINEKLIALVDRFAGISGERSDLVPGLRFIAVQPNGKFEPKIVTAGAGLMLSGSKTRISGAEEITYSTGRCCLTSTEQTGNFLFQKDEYGEHTRAVAIDLDPSILREFMTKLPAEEPPAEPGYSIYQVYEAPASLYRAFYRLAALADAPEDIPALAPLYLREIHYRLLSGPWRSSLTEIFGTDGAVHQITQSVQWITEHCTENFRFESVAERFNMSIASFNRHFRAVMKESPLQYKKNVRLIMARRLLETEQMNADTVAWHVGYKSTSQFHRDFKNKFGMPPISGRSREAMMLN